MTLAFPHVNMGDIPTAATALVAAIAAVFAFLAYLAQGKALNDQKATNAKQQELLEQQLADQRAAAEAQARSAASQQAILEQQLADQRAAATAQAESVAAQQALLAQQVADQQAMNQAQRAALERERIEREEEAQRRRRAQAEQVTAWAGDVSPPEVNGWTRLDLDRREQSAVYVRNASPLSIHNVFIQLVCVDEWDNRNGTRTVERSVVSPSSDPIQLDAFDKDVLGDWSVELLDFSDSAGVRWQRDEKGRLQEVQASEM